MGRLADRGRRGRVLGIAIGIQMAGAFLTMAPGLALKILGIGVFTFGFFGGHAIAAAWVTAFLAGALGLSAALERRRRVEAGFPRDARG